jgi:hypothetical protein
MPLELQSVAGQKMAKAASILFASLSLQAGNAVGFFQLGRRLRDL